MERLEVMQILEEKLRELNLNNHHDIFCREHNPLDGTHKESEVISPSSFNAPWVDVRDYRATGDGVTDDTAAIQAAIDATSTGIVFFPAGSYMLSSALTVDTRTNTQFLGAGKNITHIYITGNHSGFSFTGVCSRIALKDMWIGSAAERASGGGISFVGTSGVHSDGIIFENIRIQNIPTPIYCKYIDRLSLDKIEVVQSIANAVKNVGLHLHTIISSRVRDFQAICTTGTFGNNCVRIDADCDTIIFDGVDVSKATGYGFHLINSDGTTGPRLIRLINCYAENCTDHGFVIKDGRDIHLQGCHAAVNGGSGFLTDTGGTLDSVRFIDCIALQNDLHGYNLSGGDDASLLACTASNNSQDTSDVSSGIYINQDSVRVIGSRSGDFIYSLANKQKYGLSITVGKDNIIVGGNDFRDNNTGAILNSSLEPNINIYENLP